MGMLYVWTKNYPQVVGTCSGHHRQLISQNCVLKKIRAEPPPPHPPPPLNCVEKGHKLHTKCYMISNPTPKFIKAFFPDLAKSGRSEKYLAGTGPEPDLEKMTGSTGTGTGFPVAHCRNF